MNTISKSMVLLFILIVICMPFSVLAQPGFDPGITDGAPLDGGLSMLAVAGVVYGVKKLNKTRKNNQNKDNHEESF